MDNKTDNRKKIKFTYDEKEYTLAFSLSVLRRMEKKGKFKISELQDQLLNAPYDLFITSFEQYHGAVPMDKRKLIFEELSKYSDGSNEEMLSETLGTMLVEAIESMNPSGNVKWRVE